MNINKNKINELKEEYKYTFDLFEENENTILLKVINELDIVDYTIITLYAELKSYRKLSKYLNLSTGLISREINRIKTTIKDKIKRYEHIY